MGRLEYGARAFVRVRPFPELMSAHRKTCGALDLQNPFYDAGPRVFRGAIRLAEQAIEELPSDYDKRPLPIHLQRLAPEQPIPSILRCSGYSYC